MEQIELLDRQINDVESEMIKIMLGLDSVIMTIPGTGYINGGMILGEIGDIHRFSKLLAFAGLDPSIYQSENFNASHTRMSKRGSRILRYALINAAHNELKTTTPSRLTTTPRWLKTGTTIMLWGIVPANLSESFLRC